MAQCDMCGKDTELIKTLIEGTQLYVCRNCSKFGTQVKSENLGVGRKLKFKINKKRILEDSEIIVSNFSQKIKKKREKLGLKQKDLAKILAEKESVIHKIESGNLEPPLKLAKKIEKKLNLQLVITNPEEKVQSKEIEVDSKDITIGDLIKIKKNI